MMFLLKVIPTVTLPNLYRYSYHLCMLIPICLEEVVESVGVVVYGINKLVTDSLVPAMGNLFLMLCLKTSCNLKRLI
jgi:hypothetical protein